MFAFLRTIIAVTVPGLTLLAMHGPAIAQAVSIKVAPGADEWQYVRGDWAVQGGVLEQRDKQVSNTLALLEEPVLGDFEYEASFKALPGGGVRAAGLVFRAHDEATYYYTHFDTRGSKAMLLMSTPDQPWNEIARVEQLDISVDSWHTARVESTGPAIRVYLDGELLFDELDDTFVGGRFGLRTSQGAVQFKDIVIEGQSASLADLESYEPPPFVVVCEDAGAGADEEFPDVARLSNGDLICVFYAGYAHGSKPSPRLPKGGRISYVKSSDNGKSWSKPKVLHDSPLDDRDPSIVEVEPGKLLCNFFTYTYPDPENDVLANAKTYVLSSTDYGETWNAEPVAVPTPFGRACATSDPILELPNGELVMGIYGDTPENPYHHKPAIVRSSDGGETWGDIAPIVEGYPEPLTEPALCLLPDGRLICMIRPVMLQTYSEDGGKTWSEPETLPFPGDAPYVMHANGVLLAGFRYNGTSLAYSHDLGATWLGPKQIDICLGAYPSMAQLPDGSVLFVYYTGGAKSDIRALRLEADKEGVRVVPFPD